MAGPTCRTSIPLRGGGCRIRSGDLSRDRRGCSPPHWVASFDDRAPGLAARRRGRTALDESLTRTILVRSAPALGVAETGRPGGDRVPAPGGPAVPAQPGRLQPAAAAVDPLRADRGRAGHGADPRRDGQRAPQTV